ncbi:MAG: serine protease [Chthoniobacteraceae bacterium]|nr:serine protease [Chthoniobacteraceae bacterium]
MWKVGASMSNRWFLPLAYGIFFATIASSFAVPPSKPRVRASVPSAVSAKPRLDELSGTPRAPRLGLAIDDREIVQYLEQEGRKLLLGARFASLSFDRRLCVVPLAEPVSEKLSLAQIAARAEAATVVFGEFYVNPKTSKMEFSTAAGGFLVSGSGACVTCLHVVNEKASRGLVAMTRDGQVFRVREVLATDPVDDIAILQLDTPGNIVLPILPLAPEPTPPGSSIAVMSHPDERFYMLTTGVVARNTVWREAIGEEHFMTITADFAKGSSGCPVLDDRGAVVGMVNNTESIYYNDDGKKKQMDLQMVVKNTTPSWVVRRLIQQPEIHAGVK